MGPQRAGRAVSQVYLGISAALLLGVPIGTLAANSIGWRGAFWGLGGLSLLMALLMVVFMPVLARPKKLRLTEQISILKEPYFVANVILSVVVFTAMFTAYTYLADTLERIAGVVPGYVGWWLMGFGAIGLIGNWLGGILVDRNPLQATLFFTLLLVGMAVSVPVANYLGLLIVTLTFLGHCLYRVVPDMPG